MDFDLELVSEDPRRVGKGNDRRTFRFLLNAVQGLKNFARGHVQDQAVRNDVSDDPLNILTGGSNIYSEMPLQDLTQDRWQLAVISVIEYENKRFEHVIKDSPIVVELSSKKPDKHAAILTSTRR